MISKKRPSSASAAPLKKRKAAHEVDGESFNPVWEANKCCCLCGEKNTVAAHVQLGQLGRFDPQVPLYVCYLCYHSVHVHMPGMTVQQVVEHCLACGHAPGELNKVYASAPTSDPDEEFQLNRSDFQKFGLTIGCGGCKAIAGSSVISVNHSEHCYDRILQLMKAQEGRDRLERAERDARSADTRLKMAITELDGERAERKRAQYLAERKMELLANRIDEAFKKLSTSLEPIANTNVEMEAAGSTETHT